MSSRQPSHQDPDRRAPTGDDPTVLLAGYGDSTTKDGAENNSTIDDDDASKQTVLETVGLNVVQIPGNDPHYAETMIQEWARQDHAPVRPGSMSVGTEDEAGSNELRLMNLIARGGQGEIWEAIQASLGRVIVVKKSQGDADTRVSFLKEACLSAQLDHPNIVPIYHLEFVQGKGSDPKTTPLLAMKKVTGTSWKEHLAAERQREDFDQTAFLGQQLPVLISMMNAVSYAHAKGIIHRDLKPGQVMLGEFGEVYLLDWGLAVYLGDSAGEELPPLAVDPNRMFTMNSASNPSGTPAYMAPEQMIEEVKHLGFHTDIYLIGAILYELLSGSPPHMARTQSAAMELARVNSFPPLPANSPPVLRDLVLRCLETDPSRRPTTVRDIRAVIEGWMSQSERRSESQRLTDELAAANLESMDYAGLSELSRKLSTAEREWSANPHIDELRDRLMAAFVDTALKRRDLIVAQVQAARVGDPVMAGQLAQRIEEGRRELAESIPSPPLFTVQRVSILGAWGVAVLLFVAAILTQANRAVTNEVHQTLTSLADAAARQLTPRDIRSVDRTREIYSPEFQRLYNQLDLIRQTNIDVADVYVIRPDDPTRPAIWRVVAHTRPMDFDLDQDGEISAAERGYAPGHVFDAPIPTLNTAFRSTTAVITRRTDDSGDHIVGVAPIDDLQVGRTIGLVGVEMPSEVLGRKIAGIVLAGVLGGGAILLLGWVALVAIFRSRNLIRRSRMLADVVDKQSHELSESNLYLG